MAKADDVDSAGGLLTKAIGRLPEAGSRAVVSGLILRAERVEGRRKLLRTLIVERDQALIDAQEAFGKAPSTKPTAITVKEAAEEQEEADK